MEPLDYTMGQLAVQRMRRELEAEGEMSPTRPARTVHAARGLKEARREAPRSSWRRGPCHGARLRTRGKRKKESWRRHSSGQPTVDGAIVGFRQPRQIDPILDAANLELSD